MKSYLNAKLLLFKEILSKKSRIISDKNIKQFSTIKRIAQKKGLKLLDINNEIKKIKSTTDKLKIIFKIKKFSYGN